MSETTGEPSDVAGYEYQGTSTDPRDKPGVIHYWTKVVAEATVTVTIVDGDAHGFDGYHVTAYRQQPKGTVDVDAAIQPDDGSDAFKSVDAAHDRAVEYMKSNPAGPGE